MEGTQGLMRLLEELEAFGLGFVQASDFMIAPANADERLERESTGLPVHIQEAGRKATRNSSMRSKSTGVNVKAEGRVPGEVIS